MNATGPGAPLVAQGLDPGLALTVSYFLALPAALFVGVSLFLISERGLPWMAHDRAHFMDQNPLVPWTVIALSGVAASALGLRLFRGRVGRAELGSAEIVFDKGPLGRRRALPYGAFLAFRDDSSAYVELLPREARGRARFFTIPTPTEEVRRAVLELLDAKGLVRR